MSATRRSITVIGSVNIDLVVAGKRLPRPGQTILADDFRIVPSGKGANQAVAAARFGGDVRFIGCVGDDEYGRLARENLRRRGVDVRGLKTVRRHTGVALIMLDGNGRNMISVASGANAVVKSRRRCDIALTQLETPYVLPNARLVVLNPAPAAPVSLRGVDIVIPNEIEAEQLTGKRDPVKAAAALRRMGARRVIITLGQRGVLDDGKHRGPFRVKAVDTVGAGDAFVGAFVAALAQDHADPVRFAQAAAALKCTRPGAQNLPTRREVERLLARDPE